MKTSTNYLFPAPRFVKDDRYLSLAWPNMFQQGEVLLGVNPGKLADDPTLAAGLTLLQKKLASYGVDLVEAKDGSVPKERKQSRILLSCVPEKDFADALMKHKVALPPEDLLPQAYLLNVEEVDAGVIDVQLQSSSQLGLFYGCLSIFQLVNVNQSGYVGIQETTIADWPELGIRLGKLSASLNSRECLETFVAWLPLLRLSHIGLQYHGGCSRTPENRFTDNLDAVFTQINQTGLLEGYVYYSPFRSGGKVTDQVPDADVSVEKGALDLSLESDRAVYANHLRMFLDMGAKGIEVDYNDWPSPGDVSIDEVLNFAVSVIDAAQPGTKILYCPPAHGSSFYHGPCSEEMTRILSQVPSHVWPIWAGSHYLLNYHSQGLTCKAVERWIEKAGRRPVLWVNRVVPCGADALAKSVDGYPSHTVFTGEFLPKDLRSYFEGAHLNMGCNGRYASTLSETPNVQTLVYLATASSFFWNPHNWVAEGSFRRAHHFIHEVLPFL